MQKNIQETAALLTETLEDNTKRQKLQSSIPLHSDVPSMHMPSALHPSLWHQI